jgi:ADP-ribose pyrophosphatase YjhB (NUDIX family)
LELKFLDEYSLDDQAEIAAELIRRFAGSHPVKALPKPLFHSWVTNLPNCPVELAILRRTKISSERTTRTTNELSSDDKYWLVAAADEMPCYRVAGQYEILLAQRAPNDTEFPGEPWHWPGSVILPGQTIGQKLQAILDREVAGATVTAPQFVTIYEHVVPDSYRKHEDCFLHACLLEGEWNEEMSVKTRARFFPLNEIPENTIESHKEYCRILDEWLLIKDAMESADSLRAVLQNGRITGMPKPW